MDMDAKSPIQHIENGEEVLVKDVTGRPVAVDYSGAHEKVSPEEIRLVKKLDRRIMVSVPETMHLNSY